MVSTNGVTNTMAVNTQSTLIEFESRDNANVPTPHFASQEQELEKEKANHYRRHSPIASSTLYFAPYAPVVEA